TLSPDRGSEVAGYRAVGSHRIEQVALHLRRWCTKEPIAISPSSWRGGFLWRWQQIIHDDEWYVCYHGMLLRQPPHSASKEPPPKRDHFQQRANSVQINQVSDNFVCYSPVNEILETVGRS